MTDAFNPVGNTLWHLANNFVRKHGTVFGTVDDIFGELAITFIHAHDTWNGKRGTKFNSFVHYKCYMRLKDIERGRGPVDFWTGGPNDHYATTRWQLLVTSETEWEPPSKSNSFLTIWTDLSDDARMIVRLVLDTPSTLARVIREEGGTRFSFRSAIRSYLDGRGWKYDRITNAYLEIQDNLK